MIYKFSSLGNWLKHHFLEKKLNTRFGWILLTLLGLIMTYGIVLVDSAIGPFVVVSILVVLLLILVMRFPYFGFYFLIGYSSITTTIDRLITSSVSAGVLDEVLIYLVLFSVLLKNTRKKITDHRFWSNPITLGILILFGYYLIELFNPAMLGTLGWLSFFNRQLSYFVFYFITYCLLDSRERILYFVRFMIVLTTLLALYACKQQWFGYAGFELRWIGTGGGLTLLLQAGMLRKFSVFSDPATSGILFASISVLCIVLFVRTDKKKERIWLGIATVFNLLAYSYSGTRTATLMIVVGIALYCLSTLYEKRTAIFLLFSVSSLVVLLVMPHQNSITNRIRSAFLGTKDESAAVRDFNRHQVQPYIQDHPIGGGIYTCGFEGPKYNHGHYLEYLQPDSGYMKTVAEQGAVGLALLLLFYFIVMWYGYRRFLSAKDPEIQNYYIALLIMMFTLMAAQYSQMAITQCPVILYFHTAMIIFIKLADSDKPAQTIPIITNQN
ncbi:MAG: O-antigen ligase family protein [Bacteroidota bacterium]|nr:O-antigen ligase family protein [Bacteroidota bacterium]